MKNILIASFDLEIGGVERSLISMLDHFDYDNYKVDLMLYRHQGDFMNLLTTEVNLLKEIPQYATFRKSISDIIKERHFRIGMTRILSKLSAYVKGKMNSDNESGYYQMQLMWKYALSYLPKINHPYDVAISYLWPHYFIAEKVQAKKKIAWIHTDYSTVTTDVSMDLKVWKKFDHIIAVSEACGESFLRKYPELEEKVKVIENIASPELIKKLADEKVDNPMVDDDRFKVVTVARLSHAKGIDQAVKALKLLRNKEYENIVWYVIGYGGDEGMLRKLIRENDLTDNFILLGKKSNPYPFMKAADLYVQPSRYEGKAVTVGEAQILAKPVLITNYPTAQSQVRDKFDGSICDLSVEGIADGIERLYKNIDQRKQLANSCKKLDYHNNNELEKLYNMFDFAI
ncbi:glycosyltransferase [Lentibacillus sp. Marseille-P4043]|uniref:glycosyltransferase n=1 Tax=Lentibacillus sp. Marseille-P4043 TaxID=2040293 RepID=UPI000D0B0D45|nr:glycosyltransferase [Lentibacillus sp. Marseille-P4043]